jgi:transcriptional regulator NrdR family protein
MNCPNCKSYNTTVFDTRLDERNRRRRRRKCLDCKYTFATIEVLREEYQKMEADAFKGRISDGDGTSG